jgi:hypothetical protein
LAISPRVANESVRKPDRVAGALAAGFVVILLATEAVLTLPDETANPRTVASFYATHRAFIIILQLLGVVAAALLGGYAWRLRSVDRVGSAAGMIMAGCGLIPSLITLVIAIVADPSDPSAAGLWNALEPRGDEHLVRRDRAVCRYRRCAAWQEVTGARPVGPLCCGVLPDSSAPGDRGKQSWTAGRNRPTVLRVVDRGDGNLELPWPAAFTSGCNTE